MITTNCTVCGKEYQTWPRTLRRVKNPTCSRQCNGKERAKNLVKYSDNGKGKRRPGKGLAGSSNPAWKGGATLWRKKGNYKPIKYVRCPAEFLSMSRKDGYVMEHRLIAARMFRRCLTRREVVHHRDHDPQNNAPMNLMVFPNNRAHKLAEAAVSRAFLLVLVQP